MMLGQGEMNVYIWIFGTKVGVDSNLDKKTAFQDSQPIFQIFRQKITGFDIWNRFGSNLEVPNIWIFGYLDRKNNHGSHPILNTYFIMQHKINLFSWNFLEHWGV
jgi:hypothetical protein